MSELLFFNVNGSLNTATQKINKIIDDSSWKCIRQSNTPLTQLIFEESFYNYKAIAVVTNVGVGIGVILPGYKIISISTIARNATTDWSYIGNFQIEIYGSSMEAMNLTFGKYYKTHEPAFVGQGEIYTIYICK